MSTKDIMTLVESQRSQIALALPAGIDIDRIVRMTRTAIATSDILQKCSPRSVLGAAVECAQLGLEPGITAHLVPFYDGRSKTYKATLIADYRGLMELARRSGEIRSIYADVIREGDEWQYERGDNPRLTHKPKLGNQGEVIAAYAVAHWKDSSTPQFEIVARADLDKVRDASLAKIRNENARKYSPWTTSEDAMQRKTAVRRLCKYLPISTENADLQRAIILDEQADRGEQQLGVTIDVEPEEVPEAPALTDEQKQELSDAIDAAQK